MHDDFLILGTRLGRVGDQPFGLWSADRRQHLYIIGQTGAGKTTLLKNLILQDIEAGRGVAVIDPHGDLAEELLDSIPPTAPTTSYILVPPILNARLGSTC